MKEIADHTQMAASVLSSLYSSVLPTFIGEVKKGIAEEEALDYALSQVNNVSKKRLLGNLDQRLRWRNCLDKTERHAPAPQHEEKSSRLLRD